MSLGRNPAILRLLRRFVRWPGAITIAPALLPLLCAIAIAPALLPLLRTIAAVPHYCVASALLRLLRAIALLPHVAAAPHYCGCSGTIAAAPRYCHCSGTIAAAPALLPLLRIIAAAPHYCRAEPRKTNGFSGSLRSPYHRKNGCRSELRIPFCDGLALPFSNIITHVGEKVIN